MSYSSAQPPHRPTYRRRMNTADNLPGPMMPASSQQNIVLPGVRQAYHPGLQHMVAPGPTGRMPLISPPNMLLPFQPPNPQQIPLQAIPPSAFPTPAFPGGTYPARLPFASMPPPTVGPIGLGANTSISATAIQQQSAMTSYGGAGPRGVGGAKRKGPSRAVKIVDPSTMEEVDVSGSGGGGSVGVGTSGGAPAANVSRPSADPHISSVKSQFHQQVHQTVKPPPQQQVHMATKSPNALITPPPEPSNQPYPQKVVRPHVEEVTQGPSHTPNPNAQTFYPGVPPGSATGQLPSYTAVTDVIPPRTSPAPLDTSQLNTTSTVRVAANGHAEPIAKSLLTGPHGSASSVTAVVDSANVSTTLVSQVVQIPVKPVSEPVQPVTVASLDSRQVKEATATSLTGFGDDTVASQILVKPVSEPAQPVGVTSLDSVKTMVIAPEHKQVHLPDQGSIGQPSVDVTSIQTLAVDTPIVMSSSVVPETGESAKSDDLTTPPTSLVAEETKVIQETVFKETHPDPVKPTPTDAAPPTEETTGDTAVEETAPGTGSDEEAEEEEKASVVEPLSEEEKMDTKPAAELELVVGGGEEGEESHDDRTEKSDLVVEGVDVGELDDQGKQDTGIGEEGEGVKEEGREGETGGEREEAKEGEEGVVCVTDQGEGEGEGKGDGEGEKDGEREEEVIEGVSEGEGEKDGEREEVIEDVSEGEGEKDGEREEVIEDVSEGEGEKDGEREEVIEDVSEGEGEKDGEREEVIEDVSEGEGEKDGEREEEVIDGVSEGEVVEDAEEEEEEEEEGEEDKEEQASEKEAKQPEVEVKVTKADEVEKEEVVAIPKTKPVSAKPSAEPFKSASKPAVAKPPQESKAVTAPAASRPPPPHTVVQDMSPFPPGRTTYNRDFLLSFKQLDACKKPPPDLVHHDCFRTQQEIARDMMREPRDMSRGDMRRDMYPFDRERGGGGGDRRGGRRREHQPKIIHIEQKVVELHKAEQRWVPAKEMMKELPEEAKITAELYRKFQGILNKLTPQKFQSLAEQALKLRIDTEERLKGAIDKIFTKALEEPNFSIAYANLCKVLSPVKVEWTVDGKTKFTTFRRVLLTKCQQEFEKDKKDDEEREEMLSAIEKAETEEKKKELMAVLKVTETKARKRSLGNIRFIGELFKLNMLSETIMHECMIRLLKSSSDEESLECFAGLITTTGQGLDIPEAKVRIDGYFSRIQSIIAKGKISARIRFMLQDVLDLRASKWVPRGGQSSSLKTIDQIHAEAKAEEQRTMHMVAQHQMASQFNKPPMRGDDKRGRRDNKGGGEDWQKVGDEKRGRRDEKPTKVDTKRIASLRKGGDKSKDMPLGPQGGMLRPGWTGKGTTSQDTGIKGEKEKLLKPSRSSSGGQKKMERGRERERDRERVGGSRGLPTKRSNSREINNKDRESALRAVKSQTSTEGKPHPPISKTTPPPTVTPTPPLDEDTLSRKTHTIVDELCENNDYKEAIECVKEMKCPQQLNVFVREVTYHTLEKSERHRLMASQLLRDLLKDGELVKDKFRDGLEEVLEIAEDMEVDIPRFWDYLAQLLSHPVSDPTLIPLSLVTSLMPSPLVANGKVGLLAAKVMKQLRDGVCAESAVVSLWEGCGLKWEDLGVRGDELKALLTRENLEFLLATSNMSSHLSELITQFQASDTATDDIISWIDMKCGSECRTVQFIRMLSTALLQAFVKGRGKDAIFRSDDFRRRSIVLKKYADNAKDLHMEILYTFQIGIYRLDHPPNLLYDIFYTLYELEMIDEATFIDWRDNGREKQGKGVAVHSLVDFFGWFEKASQESDPES